MARYSRRLSMYWSMNTSGSVADHFARTSGWGTPFWKGRSKYRGGLFGSGDHAAARASCVRAYQGNAADPAGDFNALTAFSVASSMGLTLASERQQGLMM